MNLVEQAQYFLESKGFLVESQTVKELGFNDEDSANVFYYIGRYIENKGPQTSAAIEKYLETKFDNNIPAVSVTDKSLANWATFLSRYFYKEGRKWEFTADGHDWWEEVAKWHDSQAIEDDPYAAIVKVFWDWYKEKKAGNNVKPDDELIKFVNNASEETIEKAFGPKYAKFAIGMLDPYMNKSNLTEEDKLIQKFWDWHRAKKAGKPYQLDQDTIDGLVVFLRKPKAVQVLQQYYYYFVRVIEKMSDKTIKTPINTDGLQKELQRIMDNLENDDFVDELERIEKNRLHGGDMTAGPVFVLPVDVIKTIRTLAKDEDNIVKSKVGKIDKDQVKDCYVYCNNELNKKFHVGKTGIFDLNIQDFYDTYKIVFQRGFNTKTLHKIFDEVCQYLLDQLDKGTAEYWKNRGKIDVDEVDDFNEAYNALKSAGYTILKEDKYMDDMEDELDSTISFGEIKNIIDKKYETKIVNDELYVYPLPEKKNIKFRIEKRKGTPVASKFAVYLTQDVDETGYYIKNRYNYYITPKNPECHYEGKDNGSMEEYAGAAESILEPAEEALKKLMKPGFFKRLFKNESAEDDALEHGLTPHESANLFVKNRKPYWAKSVKEIGHRKIPLTPSSSYSERAMRNVRGEREPYRETDLRRDNEFRLKANERLAERLKKAGLEWDKEYISKDMLSIFIGNYEFRIFEEGLDYLVMRRVLDNMLDKKTVRLNSLREIVNYVKENV